MFKRMLTLTVVLTILLSSIAFAGELNIIIWPQYHSPELVEKFEQENSIDVNFIEVDTFEKMFGYLDENPGDVDLIIFSELAVPMLIKGDYLQPLNKSLLPNMENGDPFFFNLGYDPGNKYTLSYHYNFVGLAYNKDTVSESEVTLQNYFETSEKFKGRIATFPDPRFNIGFAMKYMGRSLNSLNEDDLELTKQLLSNMKQYATEDSGSLERGIYDGLAAINEGKVDLTIYYYENPANIEAIFGLKTNIAFKLPAEGAIIGTDTMSIVKNAKNVQEAHQFINFMYDPANAAMSVNYLGNCFPVKGVLQKIEPALASRLNVSADILRACEFLMPLSDEESAVYYDIWAEVWGQ